MTEPTVDNPGAAERAPDAPPSAAPPEAPAAAATSPQAPAAAPQARAEKKIRTFLAINVPVGVVRRIVDEVATIKGPVSEAGYRVVWVPAANIHMTLKFLGAIKPEAVEAIRARLAEGLAGRGSFEVEVRGLGAFPSAERPRVLWAGVGAQPAIAALQKDVEGWMEELGWPREARPFHPHFTVGRVGDGPPGTSLATVLAAKEAVILGSGRVGEVVVYESRTLAKGAEYRPLGRVRIG